MKLREAMEELSLKENRISEGHSKASVEGMSLSGDTPRPKIQKKAANLIVFSIVCSSRTV